ncbi:HAD hydrolase-like protein [Sulfurimonas hydrogeniphila]|uniref:HAD hydrolase-like protein n=1 Tax=Sulfurimonas hydrogeniphila TaxID=2509341 RepID=UPI00165EF1F4|nr:HAD hydrolase-like protein [Sulfurimonas hydrogeniphila]
MTTTRQLQKLKNDKISSQIHLLFDLDGTLIDTDEANFLAYKEAVKQVKNIDLDLLYQSDERFTREKLRVIIPNLTAKEFKRIIEIKTNVFYKYLQNTKLNIAIVEVIKQFAKTNKIILATNSHKRKANLLLKHHSLSDIFYEKYYKENYTSVENNKYKYILDDLNAQPNDVVVFEDTKDEITKAMLLNIPSTNIINFKTKGERSYE